MVIDTVANECDRRGERRAVWNLAYLPCRRNNRLSYLGQPTGWTLMFIVMTVVLMIGVFAGCPEQRAVVVCNLAIRRRDRVGVQQQVQRGCSREGGVPEQEESSNKFCVLAGHQSFQRINGSG